MEELRVARIRRPQVLVGGLGTGKTAVIVQLNEMLAKRHAVPVPIRLLWQGTRIGEAMAIKHESFPR